MTNAVTYGNIKEVDGWAISDAIYCLTKYE